MDFYHLTTLPLERALPSIAERVLSSGGRLAVVAEDEDLLNRLDEQLWTYRNDSFLPHGRSGDQPVLLCTPDQADAVYKNIALVDGIWRDDALQFERVFHFFDAASIDNARAAWRSLADKAEVERHYWKQSEAGKWVEGP